MNKGKSFFFFLIFIVLLGSFGILKSPTPVSSAEVERRQLKMAVLPFENLSGQFGASEEVLLGLSEVLSEEYSLVPKSPIDKILTELRIRHTGFLTTDEIKKIGKQLRAETLLLGLVETYRREPFPQVSFFCKLVSTKGETPLMWSKNFCALGQTQVYLLGREGHTEWSSLIKSVAEDLLRSLPKNIEDNKSEDTK